MKSNKENSKLEILKQGIKELIAQYEEVDVDNIKLRGDFDIAFFNKATKENKILEIK